MKTETLALITVCVACHPSDGGPVDLGDDGVLSIWTIGDSITEGVNNGYRNRLFTELTQAGYSVDFVPSRTARGRPRGRRTPPLARARRCL